MVIIMMIMKNMIMIMMKKLKMRITTTMMMVMIKLRQALSPNFVIFPPSLPTLSGQSLNMSPIVLRACLLILLMVGAQAQPRTREGAFYQID